MTAPERAFRFEGAGFEASVSGGLVTTSRGRLAMAEGDAAVRQAIILLLSTSPGERVMRPRYGTHLHRLVFAPNDDTTAGLAIHYVRQALAQWEPRIRVVSVDAGADPDPDNPHRLIIRLDYLVLATQTTSTLAVSVDLGSAGVVGRLP